MLLQKMFNMPVKTLCAIAGNKEQSGNPVAHREAFRFPKVIDSPTLLCKFASDYLQPALNFTVQIGHLKQPFQGIIHCDHRNRKSTTGPELNSASHQHTADGFRGTVSLQLSGQLNI